MGLKVIFKTEKRKLLDKLAYYGIENLKYLLIHSGNEKIRAYSGILSTEELNDLNKIIGIDTIGCYFFTDHGNEIRLSPEAIMLLKQDINNNVISLNEEQAQEWLVGQDINLDNLQLPNQTNGFKVIKIKEDLISMGKLSSNKLMNYLPKERRIKLKK